MKNEKKKYISLGLVLGFVLLGLTIWTIGNVFASDTKQQTMSERLAEKLDIDKSKVDAAFDEISQERQTEIKERMASNLEKAVKDGVITNEQKQKILDKQEEVRKQMEQHRTDMRKWAEENGIDFSKLKEYGIGGMGMMGTKRMGRGMMMERNK